VSIVGAFDVYALATDGPLDVYGLTGVTATSALVLDSITTSAVFAVSFARKLRAAYVGNAMLVRRSSDNAQLAIGFSGEDVDTAALTAFVGVGNGFSAVVYDQSGSNDPFQSTAGNQPSIVVSGVVQMLGGRPTAVFNGTSSRMSLPSTVSMSHCFVVAKKNATNQNVHMLIGAGGGTGLAFGGFFATSVNIFFITLGGNLISSVNNTNPHQISVKLGGSGSGRLRIDGITEVIGTTSTTLAVNAIGVDTAFPNNHLFNGNFSEAIFYNSVLSDADELIIENNQRTYYGL